MYTQAQVIEELERRGYALTPRRLVDWRQKGLLPPLAEQGRGRGRGWTYGWDDPLVVEQAIVVEELLAWYSRADWLYLPLWCLGFPIPNARIGPHLLAIVNAQLDYLVGDAATPEDVADRISELSVAEAKGCRRRRSRRPELSAEAVEYCLNLLAGSSEYAPDLDALASIAESVWCAVGGEQRPGGQDTSWRATPLDLHRLRHWFARYASLSRFRDAVVNVSDEELQRAQDDWRTLARLERAFGQVACNEDCWEFHLFWFRMVAVFGPWLTILDLTLRRHGLASLLDGLREQMNKMAAHIETDPNVRSRLLDSWEEMKPTIHGDMPDTLGFWQR